MTAETETMAELQAKLEQAERERDHWRDALCDVLDLKNLLTEEVTDIRIDRCPPHAKGEAGEQHEPGEWVAWSAEYPEDGSVSLKMLASPPHIAQVRADEEAEDRLTAAESALAAAQGALREARDFVLVSPGANPRTLIQRIDAALSAEPRAAPPALPAELSGKVEQRGDSMEKILREAISLLLSVREWIDARRPQPELGRLVVEQVFSLQARMLALLAEQPEPSEAKKEEGT